MYRSSIWMAWVSVYRTRRANNVWLLIQHCDQDLEFQKLWLTLLAEAVSKEDAPKWHLAYLTDRILVHEGKGQLYGTQIQWIERQCVVYPIEASQELDKRREEMGLCPFAEYLSLFKEMYLSS